LIAAVFALAATAQAASGFGFALLAVPLLSLLVDTKAGVVGVSIVGLGLAAVMAARDRGHVDFSTVRLVVVAALVGMPLGLLIIGRADDATLSILIGIVVLCFTLLLWRGMKVPDRPASALGAGLASGLLSTSTGTSGPPLVIALHGRGLSPVVFRATLAMTFLVQGTLSLLGFAVTGHVTRDAVLVAAVGVPGTAAGWSAGQRIFERLNHERFRGVVLALLAFSGALTLVTGSTRLW
jgi:uncharacterized membrane protein YfcA